MALQHVLPATYAELLNRLPASTQQHIKQAAEAEANLPLPDDAVELLRRVWTPRLAQQVRARHPEQPAEGDVA